MSEDEVLSTNTVTTAWLGTAASQVFIMQLGFLLFETGMVDPIWTSSIIVKNVEDTFVGLVTFIAFGWTLSVGSGSMFHSVGSLKHAFLVGVPASMHEEVFVYAVYATTTATIMSGCILHRMKNRGYIVWCFLIVLVNYSVVAHWTWNEESWLRGLGFMDSSGAAAVHITGAVCGLVAVAFLGMRQDVMDYETGELKQQTASPRPVLVAMGTMLLWYGWFAFHLASPIVAKYDIGGRLGTIVLNTCIAPTAASLSAYLIIDVYYKKALKFELLVSCALAGLVSITASNMTCGVWQAYATGFFVSPVFFASRKLQRAVLLDDPLNIGPIHLWPGVYSIVMEGVFADSIVHRRGLVYGGFGHFGVQLLGAFCILVFNVLMAVVLYQFMKRVLFRNSHLRVSALDNYLGTNLFEVNSKQAFETLVQGRTHNARKLLYDFHRFAEMSYVSELLDFAVAVNEFKKLCVNLLYEDPPVFEADTGGNLQATASIEEATSSPLSDDADSGISDKSLTAPKFVRDSLPQTYALTKKGSANTNTLLSMFRAALASADDTVVSGRFDPSIAFFKAKTVLSCSGRMAPSFWERLPPSSEASMQEKMVHWCIEAINDQFVADFAPQSVNLPYLARKECTDALSQCKALGRVLTDALLFERVANEARRMLAPVFFQFLVVVNPQSNQSQVERILASLPSTKSTKSKKFAQTVTNQYANARVPYVIDAKWRVRWDVSLLRPRRTTKRTQIGAAMRGDANAILSVISQSTSAEEVLDASSKTHSPEPQGFGDLAPIIIDGKRTGPFCLKEILASVDVDEEVVIEMPALR